MLIVNCGNDYLESCGWQVVVQKWSSLRETTCNNKVQFTFKSKFYESLETIRYAQSKVLANYGSEGSGFESLRAHWLNLGFRKKVLTC